MFDFPNAPSVGTVFSPSGGPSWQWNGQGWVNAAPAGGVIGNIVTTVLLTSGTYIPPAGLRFLEVTLVGGGGGSQSCVATGAGQSNGGSGGGGAGTCIKLYKASDLAASEPYTVGAGGAISTDGGSTIFKGMTASGGGGAPTISSAGTTFAANTKGFSGAATGGDINIQGGDGESGLRAVHGMATAGYAGSGGSSFFAGTQTGAYSTGTPAGGLAGRFPGGGARGTAAGPSQGATTSAAAGGNGCMIIKEYF